MRINRRITGGVLFVALLSLSHWAGGEESIPHIQFQKKSFNFGMIIEGQKVHHVFRFKNTGTGNLKITKLRASCCSEVQLSHKVIPPSGEGEIKVTFDSTDRRGFFLEAIYVHTNDPLNPFDYVRIFGIILEKNRDTSPISRKPLD